MWTTCDLLLRLFHHDWLVFGEILLNKMWLSHTCPPFLSAGWNVNTSKGDSVLAPVFTEREIAKPQHMYLVQFKSPFWARVPNVFVPVAFFWNDKLFEKDSFYLSSPLVFKGWFKGLYCLLTAARKCVREGQKWRTYLNFPSKARSYIWYLPYRHSECA